MYDNVHEFNAFFIRREKVVKKLDKRKIMV